MQIKKIYVGGWFQRTMLQLTEIYEFLIDGTSHLKLDKNKLLKLHDELDLKNVEYCVNNLEYVSITTNSDINFKIYEDGLIVLSDSDVETKNLAKELDSVANYYETKLSPALNYIFSLGAPVPKELANIKTVYPYFIILDNASKDQITELLEKTDKQKYHQYNNKNFEILRGEKYYLINSKTQNVTQIERYVEEQIFIREFKGQLHRYLNMHRIIWEKIDKIKSKAEVKGKDIVKFNGKIDGYAKTINLIDSRINQMGTYLYTREKIAKNDKDLKEFLDVMGYRYETLSDTLEYMQQIWTMTKNYVDSAKKLFDDLEERVTQRSIENLTFITSIGVGASLTQLMTTPEITTLGVAYLAIFVIIGYFASKIIGRVSENKNYEVGDIEYDKNIK
jgi:hypothetical protein